MKLAKTFVAILIKDTVMVGCETNNGEKWLPNQPRGLVAKEKGGVVTRTCMQMANLASECVEIRPQQNKTGKKN